MELKISTIKLLITEKQIQELKKFLNDMEKKLLQDIEILTKNNIRNKLFNMSSKNTVGSLNNRLGEAEQRISELEDRFLEILQTKKKKKKTQMKQTQKLVLLNIRDDLSQMESFRCLKQTV